MLVNRYQKASVALQSKIYHFYLKHLKQVNNWNLVDSSAHWIMGDYLFDKDRTLLLQLAASASLWERRIAIVATWYFIRQGDLKWTFKIAVQLLCDAHDLIHKAVGWMLREAGKREQADLIKFLDRFAIKMPRTMLRYSIEQLPTHQRDYYLDQRRINA
jgi:3-methyladenine DNA glycosylase AlkD